MVSTVTPAVTTSPGPDAPAPRREELLADLHNLPGQRPVLHDVVRLADEPTTSLRTLGAAAERDPALAARLLRLANSAYYGRSNRITAVTPAVTLLGGQVVRGLAVTMALGLSGEHGPLPEGFWERATATAAGSQLVAAEVGAVAGDAFCVGLLRDVGQALLFRAAPRDYAAISRGHDHRTLPAAERAWCGTTSGEVSTAALSAAGLPQAICSAIGASHAEEEGGPAAASPLDRALRGGVLLARGVAAGALDPDDAEELFHITGAASPGAARMLVLRTAAQAAALSSAVA